MVSDVANVAFTSAGFVLTFLTLLVSFKMNAKQIRKKKRVTLEDAYKKVSLFNLFLNSGLYTATVRHLKNAVKQLIVVALLGYMVKLFFAATNLTTQYLYVVFGILLVSLVLWRSLLVLSGVLSIQEKKPKDLNEN